ncbi:MAG: sigma-70 family RNA polymerase sigma factor [Bryobacteraceae bacterium]
MISDQDLVARFRETGGNEVFRELVERHQTRVFHVVLSVLGPAHAAEAEEVAQEVFLQVYLQLSGFRGDAAFSSWVYRIAWNRAADRKRLSRFRRPHLPETFADRASESTNPLGDTLTKERERLVQEAVEALPELYRTVLRLHYWLGCPLAEMREITGIPEGNLKSYLARARKRLERRLADV